MNYFVLKHMITWMKKFYRNQIYYWFMLARNYDIKFNINEKNFFMLARKKKRKGISVGRLMRNYYKKP